MCSSSAASAARAAALARALLAKTLLCKSAMWDLELLATDTLLTLSSISTVSRKGFKPASALLCGTTHMATFMYLVAGSWT